jgi:RNA polymerase sigma-70 factor, ECF subfamily
LEEQLLIKELRNRNSIVFDYIFTSYYSGLCAFAQKYIDDRQVAEDIVQDFFVTIWMESPRLEIKSSLKSYLFTAIRNRCLDWHKHQNTSEKFRKFILSKNEESDISEEDMIIETELRQAILKGLNKCSPRCREIFTLNRIDGLTNQQIADQLGLSKRTVEVQISNALKILRTALSEYMPLGITCWLLS